MLQKKDKNLDYLEDPKYKERRKNRLLLLFFLLVFTGFMLSVSTYAWFTANRIVSVNSLNVHVESQGGIEISVDGLNWKTIINQEELEGAVSTYPASLNQFPDSLIPTSTVGSVSSGFMTMYRGVILGNENGDYIITTVNSPEARGDEGDYLAFDFFLKVDKSSDGYLTPNSTVTFTGNNNAGVENAIRIAFLEEGTVPIGSAQGSIQSLRGGTSSDLYIWEPNANTHSPTGIANAYSLFGQTITANNAPLNYSGVSNIINESQNITLGQATAANYPAYFSNVTANYKTSTGFASNQQIFDLKAGITKYRVYIWLEGQDVDCENGSSSGDLEFQFQITTNPS